MEPRHIQIVDSDPAAALVTQRGLQRLLDHEADVAVAPSPDAAWLRCLNEPIDLMIIDTNPQNVAATSLIKALRSFRPDIAVLVLTAYDSPLLRSQMRALGVDRYLAKPVELYDLEQTVRSLLADRPDSDSASEVAKNHPTA